MGWILGYMFFFLFTPAPPCFSVVGAKNGEGVELEGNTSLLLILYS